MEVKRLTVGMLQTNCYILYDTQAGVAAVIDPGGNAGDILSFLKENGLSLRDIYITHSHFDHMLAAAPLRDETGARVVCHGSECEGMESPYPAMYLNIAPEPFRACPPDIRIYGGERTVLAGTEISFMHTPGHSLGSMCIFCENYLFSGDTLFAGSRGRTDFPGGDERVLMQSLRRLYNLQGDYIVYPGHGPDTLLGVERDTNPAMINALKL